MTATSAAYTFSFCQKSLTLPRRHRTGGSPAYAGSEAQIVCFSSWASLVMLGSWHGLGGDPLGVGIFWQGHAEEALKAFPGDSPGGGSFVGWNWS